MENNNRVMPALLLQLHQLLFDYLDDEGIEFEPYEEFRSAFVEQHASTPQSSPDEILARAKAEFPDFERQILAMCK